MKAILASFAAVLVVAAWMVSSAFHTSKAAQLRACERGNTQREAVNVRGAILHEFLLAAVKARRATGTPGDLKAAARYEYLASKVTTLADIDCKEAVAHPARKQPLIVNRAPTL